MLLKLIKAQVPPAPAQEPPPSAAATAAADADEADADGARAETEAAQAGAGLASPAARPAHKKTLSRLVQGGAHSFKTP